MGKKVIVAGHSCLDITPVFSRDQSVSKVGELLAPGKLIQMEGVDIHAGGAVSNTGIAMKRLGAEVCLVTKTGKDAFGKIIHGIYASSGLEGGIIEKEGENTSYSVVLAIPGIDRIFLHDAGCNHTFSFDEIPKEKLEGASLFHFGYPPLMRRMYENDGEELLLMMEYMKSRGTATSLDLASVDEGSDAGRADWKSILSKVLPYVDFFAPSVEELCFMLDRPRYDEWKAREEEGEISSVLNVENDILPLAQQCMKMGVKVLLLKCGAQGLYYKTAKEGMLKELEEITGISAKDWCCREGFESSYVPAEVLSGTGAGDTTIAAFLTAMLGSWSFEMCIHLAAAEGASCVESYDALGGLRSLEELEERIKKGWRKQNC